MLPSSRLEEQREKRLQGQLKRLERKADEARGRRDDAITADDQVRAISELEQHHALPAPSAKPTDAPAQIGGGDVIDIDILSWRDKQ